MIHFLKKKAKESEGLLKCNKKGSKIKIKKISNKLEQNEKEIEYKPQATPVKVEVKKEQNTEGKETREEIKDIKIKDVIQKEYDKNDIKKEKRKEDKTKEKRQASKENKYSVGVKLKEEPLENKKQEKEEIVEKKSDQDSKECKKKILEGIKKREHHRRREKHRCSIRGTREDKCFEKRRSFEKTRLFQDKEDRRKHQETLVR